MYHLYRSKVCHPTIRICNIINSTFGLKKPEILQWQTKVSIWALHLQSLQALLESDGLNPPEAGDLAFCILSYERNVQSRRKLHHALRHLMRAANQLIRQCQGLTICGILMKFTERTHSVICKRGYLRSTLFSGDYDVLFP